MKHLQCSNHFNVEVVEVLGHSDATVDEVYEVDELRVFDEEVTCRMS